MSATISATTRIACVIGNPARHSLSPAIHNSAFAVAGVDAVYVALEIGADSLRSTIATLRTIGFVGASVTMPYKEFALELCDESSDTARALGSVNTLVPLADGRLRGESTDGAGCVGALRESGTDPSGRRCIVVGAGATARACVIGLAQAGAEWIGVLNRTPERALSAAALAPGIAHVASTDDIEACDIIVHTTPAGMGDNVDFAFDVSRLGSRHTVLDAVYQPLETVLLAVARESGARCVDGLSMLVHQAVEQQRLWTGNTPDSTVMRHAADLELARRREMRRE
jgi:shikimate dehydrogenase